MSKEISSTDLQVKLIMQQFRENFRRCALNNFNCPNIPPSENTDNKESTKDHTHVVTKVGEVDKGFVDSVGDALFNEHESTVINMVVNHRITLLKVSQKTDLYPQIYKVLLSVEKKTRFNNEQISYEQSLFNKECEL